MKNLFVFVLVLILFGCNPSNPNPSNTYTVKYEATGNDDYFLFNIYNSTGGQDSYNLIANQNWTYEFNASSGQMVGMMISGSEQLPNAMFSLKIYLNGVLWKEANGGPDISVSGMLE
jgi:hypothetical protein